MSSTPVWPAILKLDGDDELLFIASQSQFEDEATDMIFSDEDMLIDSEGTCFLLSMKSQKILLVPHTKQFDAIEVSALVQAHEFCKAEVCLTKIHFPTVREAIAALAPFKR
ncbi:DUF4144 domain-containing protein [Grimontia kaedaensis]|uniref:DUF4144 domain-containing protein n=1 Tax=Grimontia kaedaensis TaxID=2872157 RepID=A0ABY4X001_9GAMM|nr:DUF4144 domain-containing protein [Grimontia kaedaensis]USH04578.1 DUF4144 domain-containing protein [Grimontia kaedaensis]